jgi:hypothetical protein
MLIEDNDWLLLTDPWQSSTSFDSWVSNPPSFLNEDLFANFLNVYSATSGRDKVGIVISHPHDDHCDDLFLKKLNSDIKIFIPNYETKSARKRVLRNNFKDITEINDASKVSFGPFSLTANIIEKTGAEEDAIIGIFTDEYSFVHGNDNSCQISDECIDFLKSQMKSPGKKFFASQTNIANGFPFVYPQYREAMSEDALNTFVKQKITKSIQVAIKNATRCGCDEFIGYAGYTAPIPYIKKRGRAGFFYPSPQNIKKLNLSWGNLRLNEIMPGDTLLLPSGSRETALWNRLADPENLFKSFAISKVESETPKKNRVCQSILGDQDYSDAANFYLSSFNDFLLGKFRNKLPQELDGKTLQITLKESSVISQIKLGDKNPTHTENPPNKEVLLDKDTFIKLMNGTYSFESLYIGFLAEFTRNPPEVFNAHLMNFLCAFGYYYRDRLREDFRKLSPNFF